MGIQRTSTGILATVVLLILASCSSDDGLTGGAASRACADLFVPGSTLPEVDLATCITEEGNEMLLLTLEYGCDNSDAIRCRVMWAGR